MSDGDTLYWKRLSKRIQLTFESHFCEYDVCDFSVTFRFCSFLANFSRIWFCISSRLVLPIIPSTKEVVEEVTKNIFLNPATGTPMFEKWEMGKKYTIYLTFTLDEILWDPAVQDWENVNIGAGTKPIIVG